MFEREIRLHAFLLDYAKRLAEGIDDERMVEQPSPGMNHPAWIYGHLALCTDYALGLLGAPKLCPEPWTERFGPGSALLTDRSAYPSKGELLDALARGHEAVAQRAASADPATLDQPHPFKMAFLEGQITTVGEMLAHLMTTHEASHLGQLSAWRRAMGMPEVLRF
jgi:hypothetical protein